MKKFFVTVCVAIVFVAVVGPGRLTLVVLDLPLLNSWPPDGTVKFISEESQINTSN